jgi:hypothetical protein
MSTHITAGEVRIIYENVILGILRNETVLYMYDIDFFWALICMNMVEAPALKKCRSSKHYYATRESCLQIILYVQNWRFWIEIFIHVSVIAV